MRKEKIRSTADIRQCERKQSESFGEIIAKKGELKRVSASDVWKKRWTVEEMNLAKVSQPLKPYKADTVAKNLFELSRITLTAVPILETYNLQK